MHITHTSQWYYQPRPHPWYSNHFWHKLQDVSSTDQLYDLIGFNSTFLVTDKVIITIEEQEFNEEIPKALDEIYGCQNEIEAFNKKASEEILIPKF